MPYSQQLYLEIRNLLQPNDGAEDAPAFAEQVVVDAVATIESRYWGPAEAVASSLPALDRC